MSETLNNYIPTIILFGLILSILFLIIRELEKFKKDLTRMFNEKFEEINKNLEINKGNTTNKISAKETIPEAKYENQKEKEKKNSEEQNLDQRIESIRLDIMKMLEKLEKTETED